MTTDWNEQTDAIAAYYDQLIGTYGHDPRSCDYGRASSQERKFRVLADVMPLEGKRVLDVGCGFADFYDYLTERYGQVHYEGVDITPQMIAKAQELHPELALSVTDILESNLSAPYDLVTANGIFYLLGEGAWERMQQLIARMFALSSHAVAFNTLSTLASEHEPGEFYADPTMLLAYCQTLTPWVTLRHDYLQHDCTVYLFHSAPDA